MNLDEFDDWLEEVAQAAITPADLPLTAKQLPGVLAEDTEERFASGKGPDGEVWPPLKSGKARTPLTKTRKLRESAIQAVAAADVVPSETSWVVTVDVGQMAPQAQWQRGGTKTIPAREFLGVSDAGLERVAELAASEAADKLCH